MDHRIVTWAWTALLLLTSGFTAGAWVGMKFGPSYHDALTVERRLREVFCEQAIRNQLLKTCEVTTQ